MRVRRDCGARAGDRGAALVGALMVVALATAAAVAMATRQQVDLRRTEHIHAADRAYEYALAVEAWAMSVLQDDGRTNQYDAASDAWGRRQPTHAVGRGRVEVVIEDLQGRFNLNVLRGDPPPTPTPPLSTAAAPARATEPGAAAGMARTATTLAIPEPSAHPAAGDVAAPPAPPSAAVAVPTPEQLAAQTNIERRRFRRLLELLEIDPQLAGAIIDWIDADSVVTVPGGAEDEYYMRVEPGYRTANQPLVDLTELLLVRGMTAALYARLAPHVTALPPGVPVNVNSATPIVLQSLAERLDRITAERIVRARADQPYPTLDAFMGDAVLRDIALNRGGLAVSSAYFRLGARIAVDGASIDYSAWVYRPSRGGPGVWRRERGLPDG
jgi:type II secretory pathway component PulK